MTSASIPKLLVEPTLVKDAKDRQPPHARQWRGIDRSAWGYVPGIEREPDKLQFVDEETGYWILLLRHPSLGTWNAVVAFGKDHPAASMDQEDLDAHVTVHGGVTLKGEPLVLANLNPYAEWGYIIQPDLDEDRPAPPAEHYVGFDCSHPSDLMPAVPFSGDRAGVTFTYRNLLYATSEALKLARQLKTMELVADVFPVGETMEDAPVEPIMPPEALAAIRASLDLE